MSGTHCQAPSLANPLTGHTHLSVINEKEGGQRVREMDGEGLDDVVWPLGHPRYLSGGGCAMIEKLHHNDGRTLYVLSGKVGSGSSALLLDPSSKYTPYIAVAALYEDCWWQGTYCETLNDGIDALRENRGLEPVRW